LMLKSDLFNSIPVLLFLACIANAAFGVRPSLITMQVKRGEYNGWIEVSHFEGEIPHAVELIVKERILDFDGNVKDTLVVNGDFLIYPSRIVLYPKETVRVQVLYRGKEKINADKAFVLYAREIPLPEGQKEERTIMTIAVMVNYSVGILMDTGKPGSLSFVSSRNLDSGRVELVMENKSQGRFPLEGAYIMAGKNKIADFSGKTNSVMPGQKRRFVFNHNRPLYAEEVKFGK